MSRCCSMRPKKKPWVTPAIRAIPAPVTPWDRVQNEMTAALAKRVVRLEGLMAKCLRKEFEAIRVSDAHAKALVQQDAHQRACGSEGWFYISKGAYRHHRNIERKMADEAGKARAERLGIRVSPKRG